MLTPKTNQSIKETNTKTLKVTQASKYNHKILNQSPVNDNSIDLVSENTPAEYKHIWEKESKYVLKNEAKG